MSHTLKVFLKIIHNRVKPKWQKGIKETPFGFEKSLETREALFSLNTLHQNTWDLRREVFAFFQHHWNYLKYTPPENRKIYVETKDLYIQQLSILKVFLYTCERFLHTVVLDPSDLANNNTKNFCKHPFPPLIDDQKFSPSSPFPIFTESTSKYAVSYSPAWNDRWKI